MKMSNGGSPHVSIIVPVHNRERFLRPCLESILAQTFADFEILAVDDGSTDGTADILRDFAAREPARLRILRIENQGPYVARNTALAAARGRRIAFADSDDRLHPDKLARQVAFLDTHPDVALVYTHYGFRDEAGHRRVPPRKLLPGLRGDLSRELILRFGASIPWPTVMLAADTARRAGPFDTAYRVAMDREWGMRVAQLGVFDLIPQPLYEFTLHANQISQRLTEREEAAPYVLEKALALLPSAERPRVVPFAAAEMHLQLARLAYLQADTARARRHVREAIWYRSELRMNPQVFGLRLKILCGQGLIRRVTGRLLSRRPRWVRQE